MKVFLMIIITLQDDYTINVAEMYSMEVCKEAVSTAVVNPNTTLVCTDSKLLYQR